MLTLGSKNTDSLGVLGSFEILYRREQENEALSFLYHTVLKTNKSWTEVFNVTKEDRDEVNNFSFKTTVSKSNGILEVSFKKKSKQKY